MIWVDWCVALCDTSQLEPMTKFKRNRTGNRTYLPNRPGFNVLSHATRLQVSLLQTADMLGSEQEAKKLIEQMIFDRTGKRSSFEETDPVVSAVCAERAAKVAFERIIAHGDPRAKIDTVAAPWLSHILAEEKED